VVTKSSGWVAKGFCMVNLTKCSRQWKSASYAEGSV
jgi:hypothetical protein